jgi:hypothetical protein
LAVASAVSARPSPQASSHAACHIVSLIAATSMYASASRCATAWNAPIGRPNCTRVRACSAVSSSARSTTPACIAHRPTVARATSQPATSAPPSTRSSPSTTPSSVNRPAGSKDVRTCRSTLTPASDGVTRNTRTPSADPAGTRNRSAAGACSTVVFTPDSTHEPSGDRTARQDGRPKSSPSSSASAAVSTAEPCPAGSAHRRCCAAVPNEATAPAPSTIEARYGTSDAERPTSTSTEHCSSSPSPAPFNDAGSPAASTPAAARSAHGSSRSARIFRASAASSDCASLTVKSMKPP